MQHTTNNTQQQRKGQIPMLPHPSIHLPLATERAINELFGAPLLDLGYLQEGEACYQTYGTHPRIILLKHYRKVTTEGVRKHGVLDLVNIPDCRYPHILASGILTEDNTQLTVTITISNI